jgi:GNAT superfamily N-acetyltransferase
MLEIRDARRGEELAVARVHVRSWQVGYRGLIDGDYLDALRPESRAARYTFGAADPALPETLLALEGGEVRGFAAVVPSRDEDAPGAGEIAALYVDPPHWGAGVGSALLAAAKARLRERGFAEAVLWVLVGNEAAERFYRADGWRRDGAERVEQPYGVVSKVVRFRRRLDRGAG